MSSTRRSSRQAAAAAVAATEQAEEDVIEVVKDVAAVPSAVLLTPSASSLGRKRRRDSTAAALEAPSTSPPPAPPTAEAESIVAAPTGRGRGRKPPANKAAEAKTEQDDRIKQQLLDNPERPLSLAQACTVYQLHLPPCAPLSPPQPQSQAPKACKPAGHPNCLHTLGYRRKGMWSTRPPHIALLGSNPTDSSRPANWYAGLRNGGATCYQAILVQSLYMNTHFRNSLMRFDSCKADVRRQWEQAVTQPSADIPAADPSTSLAVSSASSSSSLEDHLPYVLLSIFTRLALSRRSFIDPVALGRLLGVPDDVQQDAHEFRTYILQALELALLNSTYKPHHSLLQTLFEGSSKSILRCQLCGHESTTASPFIDLTLPIKGRGSVYTSMHSLCDIEQLEENAVYCSTCRAKTSMDKRLEYDSLPPYLNVQLMRFELVFAGNGVRKKKIGEKIYIPEKIRMEGCLLNPTTAAVAEDTVKTEVEFKKEVAMVQVAVEEERPNATDRKRLGRRRAGVKDEANDLEDDKKRPVQAKAKAEVGKDDESISDETAMRVEKAEEDVQTTMKRGRANATSRGRGGTQRNGANGNTTRRGRGKGRSDRGNKGRGGNRDSSTEASIDSELTSLSQQASYQLHVKQNGHAAFDVVDLVNVDDNDVCTSEATSGKRLTRATDKASNQTALPAMTTAYTFDFEPVKQSTKRPRNVRKAEQEVVEMEEAQRPATNGHMHHSPSRPPAASDVSVQPQSPLIDVSDHEGGGDQAKSTEDSMPKTLHALTTVTAELDALDQQQLKVRASVAVVAAAMEGEDDGEDEALDKRLKKALVRGAEKKKSRRKAPRIGMSGKWQTKARAARTQAKQRGDDESELVDLEDGDGAAVNQREDEGEQHSDSTATEAAINNKAGGSRSFKAKTARSSKAKRSKRAKSTESSPTPSQSPSEAAAQPAPVYSPDKHPSDYHLAAVLLHKGQYANHGHYTATLMDDNGCWWSFDDRVVTRLGERFYNKGGEVVIDAKEGKREEAEKAKEAGTEQATEQKVETKEAKDSSEQANGHNNVDHKEQKEAKVGEQEPVAEEVVEIEMSQPSAKKQRGKRQQQQAHVQTEMEVDDDRSTAAAMTDNQPARRRSGRASTKAAVDTAVVSKAPADEPIPVKKKVGRPKKSAAEKANADASGVDAKTKKEAERMYGPGGFSKDAYMLLYCSRNHPALSKLKEEQDREDAAELLDGQPPPTFLTVASHPQLAQLLIKKYHREAVERENASYQAECATYKEKRDVIEAEMERRKAEVEALAAMLQAQAIDVDKAADEDLDAPLQERAEGLEEGKRTKFVSTLWLSRFLTGWTEPEREKKANTKAKKLVAEKDEKAEGISNIEPAGQKEGNASPVIDISSDDDSSADNSAVATDKQQQKEEEPTIDEPADVESKEGKSETDKPKDDKEDDPGAIVVDHDVHISADGMEQAMRQAVSQLDPGSLTESIDSIRCTHHREKLNPHMLTAVKRITVEAWEALIRLDGERTRKLLQETTKRLESASVAGDVDMIPSSQSDELDVDLPPVPSIGLSDVCLVCARSLFLGDLTRKRKVERVKQLLDEYHSYRTKHRSDLTPPRGLLWLSNSFIQRWKKHCKQVVASAKVAKDAAQQAELADKQKELDSVELGDAMEGVKCEHNALGTDRAARLWVSRQLWQDITAMASVETDMFGVETDECPLCKQEEEQDNEEAKQHKVAMKDERSALRAWSSKSHQFPNPAASPALLFKHSSIIYLLPQSFQSDVYAFLGQRDPTNPPRPRFSAAPLLCMHRLLKYVPRPEEGVIGQGGLVGTRLGVLVHCDEKVWAELRRYQYVDADEAGVQLQHSRIVGAGDLSLLSEQWSSYELTSTPAVCQECVRKRQADEETGRSVFTKEDGGGIRVTTVATEEDAKSTASLLSSPASTSASAFSPSSVLPIHSRPRRAAAARGGSKQPLAVVELNCASTDAIWQLKMELLSQSYSAAWEPARQQWYWLGQLMDDSRTLADYGVVRGGEVKVWLGGASDWDGSDADRVEMLSEGKKGKSAAAERGFQGTALAMHARQHVQLPSATTPPQPATVQAGPNVSTERAHDTPDVNGLKVRADEADGEADDNNRSEQPVVGVSDPIMESA